MKTQDEVIGNQKQLYSYPNVYAIGHAALGELFLDEVLAEEKIDGSQFSFGFVDNELIFRSKGKQMDVHVYEKMFLPAIQSVASIHNEKGLTPNWIYRTEFLSRPEHNTLKYSRIPRGTLIGFDISPSYEAYLDYDKKIAEFSRLGLEVVPCLYQGKVYSIDHLTELLNRESILGGGKIEGVIVKNYIRYGKDKKVLIGKIVREDFKELNKIRWKTNKPSATDILQRLQEIYRAEPRWAKAVQHLRETGKLEGSPRDIGLLMQEVPKDVKRECEEEIKKELFAWAWPQVSRATCRGLPEWYKKRLLEHCFRDEP